MATRPLPQAVLTSYRKMKNKIIALLTDFGTRDYFVGAMKGAMLSINESAKIVDITHEIAPQNILSASFTLSACYKDFPCGTIFVAVVDPGVGSERRAILVETEDYFFVAPDNGLLSFLFEKSTLAHARVSAFEDSTLAHAQVSDFEDSTLAHARVSAFRVFELTNEKYFAVNLSNTFHGRDIFAPVAAHLSNGVDPSEFGREIVDYKRLEIHDDEAKIIHIDRFGNLITNLKRENLPETFALKIGETQIENLQEFYAEARASEVFMIFGSAGYLEVVAFQDSAKEILGAEIGQKIRLELRLQA